MQPKGRQMSRTIAAIWHDMPLFITAQRRLDRHGKETIVYLASTYKAKPRKHVANYRKRWLIEKFFRTAKQHLGLRDCFSRKITIQLCHIAGVFIGYSILQIVRKKLKHKTPEESIRHLRRQKVPVVKQRVYSLVEIFGYVYA